MPQVFPPSANTLIRVVVVGGGLIVALASGALFHLYRSPFVTNVNIAKEQPIPFSHQRHVAGNGIDCRYCHTSVETSSFAGIPSSETCMSCHSQILTDASILEALRTSWDTETPLVWTRLNDVPDFVYFNHSVHIAKGVGCTTCHGQVDQMPLTWKAETLHMQWCLDCHEAPQKFLRKDKKDVFSTTWKAPSDQIEAGMTLLADRKVHTSQLTNCSVCHR
jgi:hypothetical protein